MSPDAAPAGAAPSRNTNTIPAKATTVRTRRTYQITAQVVGRSNPPPDGLRRPVDPPVCPVSCPVWPSAACEPPVFESGSDAPGTIRTCDTQIRSLVLYPLSYGRPGRTIPAPRGVAGGAGVTDGVRGVTGGTRTHDLRDHNPGLPPAELRPPRPSDDTSRPGRALRASGGVRSPGPRRPPSSPRWSPAGAARGRARSAPSGRLELVVDVGALRQLLDPVDDRAGLEERAQRGAGRAGWRRAGRVRSRWASRPRA